MKRPTLLTAKLSISNRLVLQMVIFALSLVTLSAMGYNSLKLASTATHELHELVSESTLASRISNNIQANFINVVNSINNGTLSWPEGLARVEQSKAQLQSDWQTLTSLDKDAHQNETQVSHEFDGFEQDFTSTLAAYDQFIQISEGLSRANLELFAVNDLNTQVDPFLSATQQFSAQLTRQSEAEFTNFESVFQNAIVSDIVVMSAATLITLLVGLFTYRSIQKPTTQIAQVIQDVQQGHTDARTGLTKSRDELSTLGATLDAMLDERNATLQKIESENERINESVIELLEGTSQLSDRDLRVRLTVREDITGPVADAMNMATSEIGEALAKIRQISDLVGAASSVIDEQSSRVHNVTDHERQLVNETITKLEAVSNQMMQIAKWSQASNQIAKRATEFTDNAYQSVTDTVESMDEIRTTISETEKRIKRLSERSQEISSIIDIINSIAERTHVLALNASMQAAAAGDAGRGFAVVADEVQRLAENSRDSTSQISVLVRNIQSETASAVDTMNASINEVVAGSKLAKQAGEQMKETQSTTNDLARAIAKISEQSILQARETEQLKKQSHNIQKSTEQTRLELARQAEQTRRLSAASKALATTVSVFNLPENLTVDISEALKAVTVSSEVVSLTLAKDQPDVTEGARHIQAIG